MIGLLLSPADIVNEEKKRLNNLKIEHVFDINDEYCLLLGKKKIKENVSNFLDQKICCSHFFDFNFLIILVSCSNFVV